MGKNYDINENMYNSVYLDQESREVIQSLRFITSTLHKNNVISRQTIHSWLKKVNSRFRKANIIKFCNAAGCNYVFYNDNGKPTMNILRPMNKVYQNGYFRGHIKIPIYYKVINDKHIVDINRILSEFSYSINELEHGKE